MVSYMKDSKSGQNSGEREDDSHKSLTAAPEHGIEGIHLKTGRSVHSGHGCWRYWVRSQRSDNSRDQYQYRCESECFVPAKRPEGDRRGHYMDHYRREERPQEDVIPHLWAIMNLGQWPTGELNGLPTKVSIGSWERPITVQKELRFDVSKSRDCEEPIAQDI